jgi:hypothetical protein
VQALSKLEPLLGGLSGGILCFDQGSVSRQKAFSRNHAWLKCEMLVLGTMILYWSEPSFLGAKRETFEL